MIKCQYVPRIKDEEFTPCLTMPAKNKLEAGCKFASQLIAICLAFSALFLLREMQRCDSSGGPRLHGSPQAPDPRGSWAVASCPMSQLPLVLMQHCAVLIPGHLSFLQLFQVGKSSSRRQRAVQQWKS